MNVIWHKRGVLMLKGNQYRSGINDRPLTLAEIERLRKGGLLYKRTVAPQRPASRKENNCGNVI